MMPHRTMKSTRRSTDVSCRLRLAAQPVNCRRDELRLVPGHSGFAECNLLGTLRVDATCEVQQFGMKPRIRVGTRLDRSDSVQHRRVVTSAKAASNLGQ